MHLDEDVSTQAFEVDIFVSHSWSSDGWPKYLALCRVLNLGKAADSCSLWCWFTGCFYKFYREVKVSHPESLSPPLIWIAPPRSSTEHGVRV